MAVPTRRSSLTLALSSSFYTYFFTIDLETPLPVNQTSAKKSAIVGADCGARRLGTNGRDVKKRRKATFSCACYPTLKVARFLIFDKLNLRCLLRFESSQPVSYNILGYVLCELLVDLRWQNRNGVHPPGSRSYLWTQQILSSSTLTYRYIPNVHPAKKTNEGSV